MIYTITIGGKGGHGSRPDLSINPIDCFAAIHTALRSLPGFFVERVDGGTSGNVIPAKVVFTFRCDAPRELIVQVAENTALPYRCTVEL